LRPRWWADGAGASEVDDLSGGDGISCTLKDSQGPYKKNKFDFVAAYVIPEDVCFILPEKKVRGMWSVGLYPKLESSKYHEYNEAWHLLRGEAPGLVAWIEACAEEYIPAG
jgi:hypothetical protein